MCCCFLFFFLGVQMYLRQPVKRWLPAPWRSCWPAPPARRAARSGWAEPGWTGGCWTGGASQRTRLDEPCRKSCNFVSRTVCWGCPRCWRGSAACWSWLEAASGPADFASCFPLHHIWPLLWMSSLVVRRVYAGLGRGGKIYIYSAGKNELICRRGEGKKSHITVGRLKKTRRRGEGEKKKNLNSKMGCLQSVDPREQPVRRSEMPPWKWRGPKSWRLLTSYHWLVGNQLSPVALSPSSLSLFDYVAVQCGAFCDWGCPIN